MTKEETKQLKPGDVLQNYLPEFYALFLGLNEKFDDGSLCVFDFNDNQIYYDWSCQYWEKIN